ncbi:MAG: hypothetical protein ACP5PJ_02995, partial [Acidimicrobiales bacterium]
MEAASLRRLALANFDRLRSASVSRVDEINPRCVAVDDGDTLVMTVLDPDIESVARSLVRAVSMFGPKGGDIVFAVREGITQRREANVLARAAELSGFSAWRLQGSELVQLQADGPSFIAGRQIAVADVPVDVSAYPDVRICGYHDGGSIEYRGLRIAQFDLEGAVEVGVSERDRQSRVLGFGEQYVREIEFVRCLTEVRSRRRAVSNHPLASVAQGRWMRDALLEYPRPGSLTAIEVGSFKDPRERSFAVGNQGECLAAFFGSFDPASVLESLVVLSDLREYGHLGSQSALHWYVQEKDVFPIWSTWADSLSIPVEVHVMPP